MKIQILRIPMKTSRILIPILSLAISLLWTNPASAAVKPRVKATPVPEKINAGGAKIESVSADSITVKASKTSQTYKIDSHTAITVNGKKGTAEDLKAGMRVEVDGSKIDPTKALSIKATN